MSERGAFSVSGGRPLTGRVEVPGDKSISHRSLLFGALADGESVVHGLSDGEDVGRTQKAVIAMGAEVIDGGLDPLGSRERETTINGSPRLLSQPGAPIDCGNSGTTLRLIAGVLAGFPWQVTLVGDESLTARPMDRIATPLSLMGATVEGTGARCQPPLSIKGGALRGIDYAPPNASSQVKSCVLLAGIQADGETVVREAVSTRRHTEEMLEICGADITESHTHAGHLVTVRRSNLGPFELSIPGDPSQAAFWVVAACIVPGSLVALPEIYVGAGRRGFLDVLRRMGADINEDPTSERESTSLGATADIVAKFGSLNATEVDASEITGLDEIPVLAVAAALAEGTTTFRGVSELRIKESDRLSGIVDLLRAFGASAEARGDDLIVQGVEHLHPAEVDSSGDHRMAMAAAVASLAAVGGGPSLIRGWDCVSTSYPRFGEDLQSLGGKSQ